MPNAYLWLKLVHVIAVIMWVGGVIMNAVIFSVYKRDGAAMQVLQRGMMKTSMVVLMPGSLLTLITGIVMMFMLGGHPPVWMLWGLIAGPLSSVIGTVFARRTAMELGRLGASGSGDAATVARLQNRIGMLTTLMILILLSTVAMMVLKPF